MRIRLKFLLICRSIGRCCGCYPIPLAGTEIKKGCALASPRNIRPWRGHYFYVNHSDQRNIQEVGFWQVSEAILKVALTVCRRMKVKPHHLQNRVVMTHTAVMWPTLCNPTLIPSTNRPPQTNSAVPKTTIPFLGRRVHTAYLLTRRAWLSPYLGPNMSSGLTHWSNCSSVKNPSFRAACFSVSPSLCAILAICVALSYPIWGFKAVTSISDFFIRLLMLSTLASMPATQ